LIPDDDLELPLVAAPDVTPEIEPQITPEPTPDLPPEPQPEPDPAPEPEPKPEPEKTPEPVHTPTPEPDLEPIPEVETPKPVLDPMPDVVNAPVSRGVQSPPTGASLTSAPSRKVQSSTAHSGTQTPDFANLMAKKTGTTGISGPPVGGGVSMPPTMHPSMRASARTSAPPVQRPGNRISAPPVFTSAPKAADVVADIVADAAPEIQSDGPFGGSSNPVASPPHHKAKADIAPASPPTPDVEPKPKPAPVVLTNQTSLTMTPSEGLGEGFGDPSIVPKQVQPAAKPAPAAVPTPARDAGPFQDATPAPKPAAPSTPAPAQNPTPAAASAVAPVAPSSAPAEPDAFLRGFLKGAGIKNPDDLEIPLEELGEMLGQCARTGTEEIRQMLEDRAAVKYLVSQEDRTMQVSTGNNPMKFMPDVQQAFETMFVNPRSGYLTGADGFENALTDIRLHQAALMAAVQPALSDMLDGLAPSEIEQDTAGARLGGSARKYWDEYAKRWNSRAAQGENGMLDAFLGALARRYAEALDKHI
jgi:type VI secretion system FHA domain protein